MNQGSAKKSNLPLLFTDGQPTSLECMSLEQLQRFTLFLLQCDREQPVSKLSLLVPPPQWWPDYIRCDDDILTQKKPKGLWSCNLRKVIRCCYQFRQAEYLLSYSQMLMEAMQTHSHPHIVIKDNGNGTRSLVNSQTEDILATFRNENQDYDKPLWAANTMDNSCGFGFHTSSPMKAGCSLSSESNASDPRLPLCLDLYLCEHCGQDFEALSQVLLHEQSCKLTAVSQLSQTEGSQGKGDLFWQSLHLRSGEAKQPVKVDKGSHRVRPNRGTYNKLLNIDICSPLGQFVYGLGLLSQPSSGTHLANLSTSTSSTHRHTESRNPTRVQREVVPRFPITYKPKDRVRQQEHIYCFNNQQLLERRASIETGLSVRARQLYAKFGHPTLRVRLQRLTHATLPAQTSQMPLSQADSKRLKLIIPKLRLIKHSGSYVLDRSSLPEPMTELVLQS